jgi:hypothetical protein
VRLTKRGHTKQAAEGITGHGWGEARKGSKRQNNQPDISTKPPLHR